MIVKNITMYTIPSADPKTYEISMVMEYEDEFGNEITATEYLGIPVEQVTKLEVADVVTELVEAGNEADLKAQIFNKGRTDISNVIITTTGEGFDVIDNKQIFGTIGKGEIKNYQPTIIPHESGFLEGAINIEYEDVTGKVNTLIHEFEMEVLETYMPEFDIYDWDFEDVVVEMPQEEASNYPVVAGAAAVAVLAGLVINKKRKAKKAEAELDFDDED
ncbi:MAG: hypothetical protein ATN33_03700 [Epulopiscium sp. Nele67-Bin001]|nr:MAG: hypothetical protein ATN33_03700 [Epulopiscium sp. Nele67-Bin001]